jgi:hypothetical protein
MMAQPVIYSIPHHDDLPPHRVVERRRDDGSTVRFYIADNERIVWLETVALTGDTLELDSNHVDISAFRELLNSSS